MFRALREKLLGASKQAEEELDPQLNLDYETFRPEERESGAGEAGSARWGLLA